MQLKNIHYDNFLNSNFNIYKHSLKQKMQLLFKIKKTFNNKYNNII